MDNEALEVAIADLPDETETEIADSATSEDQQRETLSPDEAKDGSEAKADAAKLNGQEKETASQRRRRQRREREQQTQAALTEANKRIERLEAALKGVSMPDPQSYQSNADYVADRAAAQSRKATLQSQLDEERESVNGVQQQTRTAAEAEKAAVVEDGRAAYSDFDSVVFNNKVIVTDAMAEAIMEADQSHDILYALGKDPERAAQIAQLSPPAQVRAIARLEFELATPKVPPQSKAPAPIKPVRGSGAAAKKSPSEMSMAEYAAWRRGQQKT